MIATKGPFFRGLALWMLCANSSFPVPVSPTMIILESDAAYRLALSMVELMMALSWMMSSKVYLARSPFSLKLFRIWFSSFWIRVMSDRVMTTPEIRPSTTTGVNAMETVILLLAIVWILPVISCPLARTSVNGLYK